MLLNTSLYTKNQASTPKTFAKIIFFISPYLGQYNKKREVFKGGVGGGRGGILRLAFENLAQN